MKKNEAGIIDQKSFGKKIKDARKKMDFTQFELAEKINVSQNFLGDIERGLKLPSLPKLILLSNTLKLSLDSMFLDSLNNVLEEPEEIYYTDKQLIVMKKVIDMINDNF